MSVQVRRILFITLAVVVILAIVAGGFAFALPRQSFPRTNGSVSLPGLDAPVEIIRDDYGIPHIYAETTHDLFFAQGYVHAQDRFWQMDFWRHIGSGRLSEMFGSGRVDTDRFLRTLGWARVAEEEWRNIDPASKAILEAYAEGVNAYLADHQGAALSLEYAILGLITPDYQPEPWEPLHSLTWAKVMAWDLGGNMDAEIEMAILAKTYSASQIAELYPAYPTDHPYIVPEDNLGPEAALPAASTRPALSAELGDLFSALGQRLASLEPVLGPSGVDIGSNNWVISGELTDSGMPLLANDPHLGIQMPSIWYEVGLHCAPLGSTCPVQVRGFSFAGAPGVVIGHNDRIAWGFTNVGPDVQDLFIEKLNPANPDQYEADGEWVDMTIVKETIQVAGGEPVELTVRYTRHGPVISDTYGAFEEFTTQAGIALPADYAIALQWTALEPGRIFPAIWQFNTAQNWDEFRRAAQDFTAPSQNLVYADVDGNIGYQMPGNIPIRAGGDGSIPVPGWTGEYDWTGYIPFEELPYAFNPPQGYIATANNSVIAPDYPYLIGLDFDPGFRAERIVEMIEGASGSISIAAIQQMQGDNMTLNAEFVVPLLADIPMTDERLAAAIDLLAGWDYQMHMDSAPAALFAVFWKHLTLQTFADQLPADQMMTAGGRGWEAFRRLVKQPSSVWWDDLTTPEPETMNTILVRALDAAVQELEGLQGSDPARWNWGGLHVATFRNQSLGVSGIGLIESIFNRGPYPTSGGSSIVNATGWGLGSYEVGSVPSMRMIVDLSNLQNSLTIHTTGQSGHAYHPHYNDMVDPWRKIEYNPMHWERAAIEDAAEGTLRLTPAE